jgi:hypothetical protein
MGRDAGLVFFVLLVACGVASGAQGQPGRGQDRWDAVEGLPVGALIEVLPQGQAGPDLCRVSSAEDSALTCVREGSMNGVRLVFPQGALLDVWLIEPGRERHIARWIWTGIEVALFVDACVMASVLGAVAVGILVLVAETAIAENPMPPRPLRMHHRLIYRAPSGPAASP